MAKIVDQTEAKLLLSAITPASILLLGPPGYGKTTLGLAYLSQFGKTLIINGTRADQYMPDISWHKGPVLIDEIHRMNKVEALYPLLDAGIAKPGLFNKQPKLKVFAFTTTDEGKLPGPFLSRLIPVALRPYTQSDLAEIAGMAAPRLPANILSEIARFTWGSPRKAKMLAILLDDRVRHPSHVGTVLAAVGYPLGLSYRQISLLQALTMGPRSITTLAGMLGTGFQTIKLIESDLIRSSLVEITNKGRILTGAGYEILRRISTLGKKSETKQKGVSK